MNQSDKQAAERGYRLFVEEIRKILNRSAILGEMHLKGVFNCEDVVKLDRGFEASDIATKERVGYFFNNISENNKTVWNNYIEYLRSKW
jgi:hypothetical protein